MNLYQIFKKYRGAIENKIHRIEPRPVIPAEEFPWIHAIEQTHPQIKDECLQILRQLSYISNFDQILPGQRALHQGDHWKSFYLVAMGKTVEEHAKLCPKTLLALQNVPHLMNAFFSILKPGTHIPAHRGPYSGILRYHLGVIIPEGNVAIRVDQQICHWQEGKSLLFDDGFDHEAWNHTTQIRVVLFVDLARPLPAPWGLINRGVLQMMGLSKEIRHAQRVIQNTQIGRSSKEAPSIL